MQKYLSKKDNETIVEFVSQNERTSVIRLKYLNGENEGKCVDISPSTLQRWWKKVSDEEETQVEDSTKEEVFNVTVVDEETGKKQEVSINPNDKIEGVDTEEKQYDFNNQPKDYVPMPEVVKEIYLLGEDPYPTVEEVVDMMVEWGADIKAYAEWIRMNGDIRIIFRRNKRCLKKSIIEVRMKEERTVAGYDTLNVPLKGALLKATPYVIYAKTLKDLETIVKALV